ncbi:glycoside hydrolase family 88/105 protein [Planosporangium sp. 12N6]|uniref:glycoside hydrolase family 88/105 protein n=1 Tax=Planosporangium spinosum TaxID=3402278 RepID=UPI003CF1E518
MSLNLRWMAGRALPTATLTLALVVAAATTATASVDGSTSAVDYSTLVADAQENRASPTELGGWGYTQGLFLYGTYLVYQRTHDPKYLSYMRAWADRFVDSSGNMSRSFNNLDSMQSGTVLLALYAETGATKYRTAATQIRNRLKTYPRTRNDGNPGAFWHATSRQNQLWADGVYMVLPFLLHYGQVVGEADYANAETVRNLNIYWSHLYDPKTGLLRHAYDESRSQSWANKTTGQAPESWCRAIGWYSMATIEALEIVPANQPGRADLVDHIRTLVAAFKKYQDPASGRWFQLVPEAGLSGNFTETSCSSMYTYTISRAVQRGYVDASYRPVADKGYRGVLARVSSTGDVREICIGTNVGDQAYYLARPRKTNDLHGLGAFLIMNEQLAR